jgi:GGDEF domain-containing protein
MFQPNQWKSVAQNLRIAANTLQHTATALPCTNIKTRQHLILQAAEALNLAQTVEEHFKWEPATARSRSGSPQ